MRTFLIILMLLISLGLAAISDLYEFRYTGKCDFCLILNLEKEKEMARTKKEGNAGFPNGNTATEPTEAPKEINKTELDDLMSTDEEPQQDPQVTGSILVKPTIGRIVLFHDGFSDQPCAAQIAYVHDDHNINIGYIDRQGLHQSKVDVRLVQDENVTADIGDCEWMEYQKSKA